MATTPEATRTRPNLPASQLALVGGVILVLLVVAWFFFLRGGGDPDVGTPRTAPAPAAEPVEPADTETGPDDPGTGKRDGGGVGSFATFAARDPFEPLISTSPGTGTTDTSATTTTDTGATVGTDVAVSGGTSGGGGGGTNVGGHRVTVIDVYERNGRRVAQVEVDGNVYTVEEGESFADGFRLVSASGQCATMESGDDRFTLCEGEEILK